MFLKEKGKTNEFHTLSVFLLLSVLIFAWKEEKERTIIILQFTVTALLLLPLFCLSVCIRRSESSSIFKWGGTDKGLTKKNQGIRKHFESVLFLFRRENPDILRGKQRVAQKGKDNAWTNGAS